MKKPKEFEELLDAQTYISDSMMNDYSDRGIITAVNRAKKDAWNAAIKCAAESCEFYCDKQLVLTNLIDD